MVRDQESLLPPHKHRTSVPVVDRHVWPLGLGPNMLIRREPRPMDLILVLGGTPVQSTEAIPRTDNLSIEVCRQLWPVFCQPSNSKVAAQRRHGEVDILVSSVDS
jgi:hypothetical protein